MKRSGFCGMPSKKVLSASIFRNSWLLSPKGVGIAKALAAKNDYELDANREVYDVTKFLEDHPGGDEVLLQATGKDATDDFEDIGHSSTVRAMMDEMYIGDVDTTTVSSKAKYAPPKQTQISQDNSPEFLIRILQFLVPLAILALAFAVRYYTKEA